MKRAASIKWHVLSRVNFPDELLTQIHDMGLGTREREDLDRDFWGFVGLVHLEDQTRYNVSKERS